MISAAMKLSEEPNEVTSMRMLYEQQDAMQRPSDRILSGAGDVSFVRIAFFKLWLFAL